MKVLWINKWRPRNIDKIVGNKVAIKKINIWLSNFDTWAKKCFY